MPVTYPEYITYIAVKCIILKEFISFIMVNLWIIKIFNKTLF